MEKMQKMNKMIGTVAIMLALASLPATAQEAKQDSSAAGKVQTLQITGSTTVGPIGDGFVEAFQGMYPDVKYMISKPGSGIGATALIEGRADIAMMSRFMKEQEFKDAVARRVFPVAHAIANDGLCIIVHPSNPISNITIEKVRDIYTGKITNWKQLGGADMPIVAISRDTESGTYESFNELVMKKEKIASGVEYVNGSPQATARVKNTPGAIGYVGLGFIDEVKALKINDISPNRKTVAAGKYPLSRPLFFFTNGYPALGSLIYEFCTFYLTEKGQQIIEDKGFIPLTNY